MQMEDEVFRETCAPWLRDVAVRVDELVGHPLAMDRFRQMLRVWKQQHDARRPTGTALGRAGVPVQDNPIKLFPTQRMTLAEKYARLAAIHDFICENAKPINPWHAPQSLKKLKPAMSYAVLCRRVTDLDETTRPRIESLLHEVAADVAEALPTSIAIDAGSNAPQGCQSAPDGFDGCRRPWHSSTSIPTGPTARSQNTSAGVPAH
jgi:hypothetical protein